jgi:CHASE2 domain-containing sensor protein
MRNRLALALAAAAAALLAGAGLLALGPLAPLQDAAYDRAILWTSRGPVDPQPVTLVAIDEPSLRRLGPWPWPRSRVAELLAAITFARPRVLSVDLMLAGLPEEADGDAEAIRAALASAPRLVLPIAANSGRTGADVWRELLAWPAAMVPPGASQGHTLLPGASEGGRGSVCRALDRELRLPSEIPGEPARVYPSLAQRAAELFRGESFASSAPGPSLRIRYQGRSRPGYQTLSAGELLAQPQQGRDLIRDRLVFVGGTAAGLPDFRPTPIGDLAGVEIQVQAAITLLRGREPRPAPAAVGLGIAAALVLGTALLVGHGRLVAGAAISLGGSAALGGVALGLLGGAGVWLDPAVPGASALLGLTAALALRSRGTGDALEHRERQLSALSRASEQMGLDRTASLAGLFQSAIDLIAALPGIDGVSGLLVDPPSGRLLARARSGEAGEVERLWRDGALDELLGGERHRAFLRAEILGHHWLRFATTETTRGAVVVRLGTPGREAGVLVAISRRAQPFSRGEADVVAALASQAALSVRSLDAARRSRELLEATLRSLVEAIEARDPYLRGHAGRVSELSTRLAMEMNLSPADRETVRLAGLLHDVGKVALPDPVLRHPGEFGISERQQMETHPEIGRRILAPVAEALADSAEVVEQLLPAVLHHHRRFDGGEGSYPATPPRQPLPAAARILAVADAFDGMVSERPHRAAIRPADAVAEIRRASGGQFDPEVVRALVGLHRRGELG